MPPTRVRTRHRERDVEPRRAQGVRRALRARHQSTPAPPNQVAQRMPVPGRVPTPGTSNLELARAGVATPRGVDPAQRVEGSLGSGARPAQAEPALHVQPKLTASAADDPLEQEADRVAARAVSGVHVNAAVTPVPVVSRIAVAGDGTEVGAPLGARIASTSGGHPLPDAARRDMESAFDADFSEVRLHDSEQDRADAESIGARAFTHKHHIWLGPDGRADDRGLLAHELTHVIQQGTDVRPTAPGRAGSGQQATVGGAPDVQGAWYNVHIPGTDYEIDPSWSGVKTAAGLVKDAAVGVGHEIRAAAEKVWDVGKLLWQIAQVLYHGAVHALIMLIEAPGQALEYIKDFVGGLVAKAPGKLHEVLAEYLAPRLGGSAHTTAGAEVRIQRQEEPATATEPIPETRWQAVMRHLGVRVTYMKDNWWQVIKDAALEVLVPGVAPYRHFPNMIKELGEAFTELTAGEYSASFDHLLATAREAMAIISSFVAQVSIAAFIIGSIIGTPIVGVAALETIGIVVIAADAGILLLSLGQSIDNLDRPRNPEQHESDYGLIADSSIAMALLVVLLALGAIASAAVKSLLRRFPALAAAAESARARFRARLGRSGEVAESTKPPELRTGEGEGTGRGQGERIGDEPRERRGVEGEEKETSQDKGQHESSAPAEVGDGVATDNDVHPEDAPGPVNEPDIDPGVCFAAGTIVWTAGGPVPIEQVRVGELVHSFEVISGELVDVPVTDVLRGRTSRWICVEFATGTVRATPRHRFWVVGKQDWLPAEDLRTGMELLSVDGSTCEVVDTTTIAVSTADPSAVEPTYNLSVGRMACYFVADSGVLAHNITASRFARFIRPGYRNYVLIGPDGKVYYSGMFGPNTTPAQVQARHAANDSRFRAGADEMRVYGGTRSYAEARWMEQELAVENETIKPVNPDYRCNRQNPLNTRTADDYDKYLARKQNCG